MERNPYLILGLEFGASREEANIAFARRSKGMHRDPSKVDLLTDLTWALNQIDEAEGDPEHRIDLYRVPAVETGEGSGVLRPPPLRPPARGGDREAAYRWLRQAAAHEYLRHLVAARAKLLAPPEA